MGTITERKRKDGSTAFMAQISIMRDRKVVRRENRTFDRRAAAKIWIKNREAELLSPGGLSMAASENKPTLKNAIDRYVSESGGVIGRTKSQVLETIKSYNIADMPCPDIGSADLVAFVRELMKAQKLQPQTAQNYLSHLGAVFSIARPAWGYELDQQAMQDAFKVCKKLGLTTKSASRDRRPTLEEVDQLMAHFVDGKKRRPNSNPMAHIVAFAIFSTRRQEEITRLDFAELDREKKRVLVRDMKHPGQKIGNDVYCGLPDPALSIIETLPNRTGLIFPYNTDAISAAFTRACKFLEIKDLRFHDLRHEGVSRLFELGWNIPHVATVSGHRSWSSLQRYAHITQSGDKYEDWPWLKILAESAPARRY